MILREFFIHFWCKLNSVTISDYSLPLEQYCRHVLSSDRLHHLQLLNQLSPMKIETTVFLLSQWKVNLLKSSMNKTFFWKPSKYWCSGSSLFDNVLGQGFKMFVGLSFHISNRYSRVPNKLESQVKKEVKKNNLLSVIILCRSYRYFCNFPELFYIVAGMSMSPSKHPVTLTRPGLLGSTQKCLGDSLRGSLVSGVCSERINKKSSTPAKFFLTPGTSLGQWDRMCLESPDPDWSHYS